MVRTWTTLAFSLGYVGLLFAIAYFGDRRAHRRGPRERAKPLVYSLSLAVYCTSWTYYGSVGFAANHGYDFLTIYIGPILMFAAGWPLLHRIVELSKRHNITSIADFIAARYGKSQWLAATVAVVAVVGIMPYIALQLKAVSTSFAVLTRLQEGVAAAAIGSAPAVHTELGVSLLLATFAILFGTRRIEATEHHNGLILAIAFEALTKLIAFIFVGAFVTWGMFGGLKDLGARVAAEPSLRRLFLSGVDGTLWVTMTGLAFAAVICLPRQFHVTIVENASARDLRQARWLFPLYLVAINLFVVPITIAGLTLFADHSVDGDLFVIALPMAAHQWGVALIAFIGGFSAATGMVIVSCLALSTMVSNDLIMPVLLQGRRLGLMEREDMGALILHIRRLAILGVMLLAYGYYRLAGDGPGLAAIGLLSFAAVAQFAPPLLGGLAWRGGSARGALAGILAGFLLWTYCLMLPAFAQSSPWVSALVAHGPLGITLLRPQALFGLRFDPLTNGVFWSLAVNLACYIGVSRLGRVRLIERIQANAFVDRDAAQGPFVPRLRQGAITVRELAGLLASYLGAERVQLAFGEMAGARSLDDGPDLAASPQLIRHAERLLASAIGAPSARLVLALAIERRNLGLEAAMDLLDDASAAIRYNRELLQMTLETVRQGISVFDRDLHLVCWNRRFQEMLGLPAELLRSGVTLQELLSFAAKQGQFARGDPEAVAAEQLERLIGAHETVLEDRRPDGRVFEIRTNPMLGGGYVTTYSDITEHVRTASELAAANELLERRVNERTAELTALNAELRAAKALAEEANLGKTRFLAAASHDLLQPLNAARLYVASLLEEREQAGSSRALVQKIDASLGSVEDLLGALLDMSRLDAGALVPEYRAVQVGELFRALEVEFAPSAARKGLQLKIVPTGLTVESDRRLLHRVLQNLLANAIRYTSSGKVLMWARRRGDSILIQVADTGVGIAADEQQHIFKEFQRFAGPGTEQGLGLGLSIVDRICRLLEHPISLRSEVGRGTTFTLRVPRGKPPSVKLPPDVPAPASAMAGLMIVCIDNDADARDAMHALLRGWGCRAIVAASLAQALAGLEEADLRPDLLVLDYHLDEDADGLRCIAELRERYASGLPAILVTGDRSEALRTRAADAGVAVLNKPVKPAALRALAMRLLAAHVPAE